MKIAGVEAFLLQFRQKAVFVLAAAFDINPLQLNGPQFIDTPFLRERVWKGGGRVTLPAGPGLGVEVDEAYVRKHAVALVLD